MHVRFSRLTLAACALVAAGIALAFAGLFSHSSRVFALGHLAGTDQHDLMVESSAATPGERWLLGFGVGVLAAAVLLLSLAWARRRRERHQGDAVA